MLGTVARVGKAGRAREGAARVQGGNPLGQRMRAEEGLPQSRVALASPLSLAQRHRGRRLVLPSAVPPAWSYFLTGQIRSGYHVVCKGIMANRPRSGEGSGPRAGQGPGCREGVQAGRPTLHSSADACRASKQGKAGAPSRLCMIPKLMPPWGPQSWSRDLHISHQHVL